MKRERKAYSAVGLPKESRDKLQELARTMGRFQSEILKELIDKKYNSTKKICTK